MGTWLGINGSMSKNAVETIPVVVEDASPKWREWNIVFQASATNAANTELVEDYNVVFEVWLIPNSISIRLTDWPHQFPKWLQYKLYLFRALADDDQTEEITSAQLIRISHHRNALTANLMTFFAESTLLSSNHIVRAEYPINSTVPNECVFHFVHMQFFVIHLNDPLNAKKSSQYYSVIISLTDYG